MSQLNLTSDEAAILRDVLESALSDLRMEVHATDNHDFKEELKAREVTLRHIIEHLGVAAAH